jgi:MbtH protein
MNRRVAVASWPSPSDAGPDRDCTMPRIDQMQHRPMEESKDVSTYRVVVNSEEQYSIWPADRGNPPGWGDTGKQGTKQQCLDYVDEIWSDMRPLSLRRQMASGSAERSSRAAD